MPPGPGLAPAPSTANVSEDPFLGYLWQLFILTFFFFFPDKEHKENCIFHFQITPGFPVHTSNGSQSGPVNDKKTSDLGIFNAALALEEEDSHFRILRHSHGAG